MSDLGVVYQAWLAAIELAADRRYTEPMSGDRYVSDQRVCPRCGSVVQLLLVQKHEDFHQWMEDLARDVQRGSSMWNTLG